MTQQEAVRKPGGAGSWEMTSSHIRGSSLMLLGRVLSMVSTFVAQVIVVRYLTKEDFGQFAYAWSVVLLLQSVLALGLDRADTRFLSLYDETRDQARFFGVLAVEILTIAATGLVAAGEEQLALLRGERWGDLERAVDRIERRFGRGSAKPATLLERRTR